MRRVLSNTAGAIGKPLLAGALVAVIAFAAYSQADGSVLTSSRSGSFSIKGHVAGLYPGRTARLALTITNKNGFAIRVRSVRVRVGNAPGCPRSNLVVKRFRGYLWVVGRGETASAASGQDAPHRARRLHGGAVPASLPRQGGQGMRRSLVLGALLFVALAALAAGAALAGWSSIGSGSATTKAQIMPSGNTPAVSVSNRDVTVTWAASTFPGGTSVDGYTIKRYDASTNTLQTIGAGCTGTVAALTCTETAVAPEAGATPPLLSSRTGSAARVSRARLRLSARPRSPSRRPRRSPPFRRFARARSRASSAARLSHSACDDPTSGTLLSGSSSPSTIPGSGSAEHQRDGPGRCDQRISYGLRRGKRRLDRRSSDPRRHAGPLRSPPLRSRRPRAAPAATSSRAARTTSTRA